MELTATVHKLGRLRWLAECPESVLRELAASGTLVRCQPSRVIYRQGDQPTATYLVVTGMVNRETVVCEGTVIQHRRALPGDWLGLANSAARTVPYVHSALVVEASEVLSLPLTALVSLCRNAEFSRYVIQVVAKDQLVEEERRLNDLSSTRSYDRLILFLAAEMERAKRGRVSMIHLPYIQGTQRYFAEAIGTTRETVTRDFQPLLSAGILERTPGVRPHRYTILRPKELAELAVSPLRRNVLYRNAGKARTHRRFSDVA